MNNDDRNYNSSSNWYGILTGGDEDEGDVGSLHTISDDSISISSNPVQASVEAVEVQQLDIEIAQGLQVLDTDIKQVKKRVNKVLSTIIDKDEEDLDFEDDDMTVLPTLEIAEEFKGKVEGVIVRADIDLFKDHLSNVIATASHQHHSGGCAHMLDDKARYYDRLSNRKATLPTITKGPTSPSVTASTTV